MGCWGFRTHIFSELAYSQFHLRFRNLTSESRLFCLWTDGVPASLVGVLVALVFVDVVPELLFPAHRLHFKFWSHLWVFKDQNHHALWQFGATTCSPGWLLIRRHNLLSGLVTSGLYFPFNRSSLRYVHLLKCKSQPYFSRLIWVEDLPR